MTPNEKLVKFMWFKHNIIGPGHGYFTEADAADIMAWDEAAAQNVVNEIIDGIDINSEDSAQLCPYCIKYKGLIFDAKCSACEYGAIHGICSEFDYDNTWGRLPDKNLAKLWEPENFAKLKQILEGK